jgi:hypothetical protein
MKDVASAAVQSVMGPDWVKHAIAVSTVAGGIVVEWIGNFPIGKLGVLAGVIYSVVMTCKVLQEMKHRTNEEKQEVKLRDQEIELNRIKIAKEGRRSDD